MQWVNNKQCDTCVFHGEKLGYGDPKKHQVVKEALDTFQHVKCHKTGLVCKGFNDTYPMHGQCQQVMTRLNMLGYK